MLGMRFLALYGSSPCLLSPHRLKCLEALALIADTEDFATYPSEYYCTTMDDVDVMLTVQEKVLSEFQNDMEKRKLVRPLVDCIGRAKRQRGSCSRK